MSILKSLYESTNKEMTALLAAHGLEYKPQGEFKGHGHDLVAVCSIHKSNEDGYDVVIDEARLPCRFYRVRALAGHDSVGESRPGFSLSTGSGVEALVVDLAINIAGGMIGIDHEK